MKIAHAQRLRVQEREDRLSKVHADRDGPPEAVELNAGALAPEDPERIRVHNRISTQRTGLRVDVRPETIRVHRADAVGRHEWMLRYAKILERLCRGRSAFEARNGGLLIGFYGRGQLSDARAAGSHPDEAQKPDPVHRVSIRVRSRGADLSRLISVQPIAHGG